MLRDARERANERRPQFIAVVTHRAASLMTT